MAHRLMSFFIEIPAARFHDTISEHSENYRRHEKVFTRSGENLDYIRQPFGLLLYNDLPIGAIV